MGRGEKKGGTLQREGERKGKERKKKKEGKKERKKETKALCISLSNLPGVAEDGASWLFEWIWFIPDSAVFRSGGLTFWLCHTFITEDWTRRRLCVTVSHSLGVLLIEGS